jgi:hypothetical protein
MLNKLVFNNSLSGYNSDCFMNHQVSFCPHSVFMCFVRISGQTTIISLQNNGFKNRARVFTARYELNLYIKFTLIFVFKWFNLRERDQWGDPAVDRRKWEGVVGTGWSWLRIGTGGGYL